MKYIISVCGGLFIYFLGLKNGWELCKHYYDIKEQKPTQQPCETCKHFSEQSNWCSSLVANVHPAWRGCCRWEKREP